ncbi:MAG: hypothetical protein QG614_318 [Patescibacteria group bacterium]|nr:hypothetical protein [Patescibacteria group bacterium]
MSNIKNNNKDKAGVAVAVGAGVAAIGAIGYLLFGPNGKKNQKAVKSWTLKMKADVIEKLEDLDEVTSAAYDNIVDEIESKYKKIRNIDEKDLQAEIAVLKKNWNQIVKNSKTKKTQVKKTVKKAANNIETEVKNASVKVKKAAKKVAKKVEENL